MDELCDAVGAAGRGSVVDETADAGFDDGLGARAELALLGEPVLVSLLRTVLLAASCEFDDPQAVTTSALLAAAIAASAW